MKLDHLLGQLEVLRQEAEEKPISAIAIIILLVEYIGNEKVKEKVNEIPF
jgi:hypothetical protein